MAHSGVYQGKPCSADSVKKKVDFQGIQVCIDRPRGFVMEGVDEKGAPWSRVYQYDYGFIPKTLGGDDDGLDVFIGPDKTSEHAYWAVQNKPDGSFDEYKVFLGFANRDAAAAAYREHIPKKFLAGLVTLKVDMMRSMLGISPQGQVKTAMFISCLDEMEKLQSVAPALAELKEKVLEDKRVQGAVELAKQYTPQRLGREVLSRFQEMVR